MHTARLGDSAATANLRLSSFVSAKALLPGTKERRAIRTSTVNQLPQLEYTHPKTARGEQGLMDAEVELG